MKKAAIAILAVLYLTITSGVVVNVHYCMGRFASVDYGYDGHDVCSKCGMPGKKSSCCHTEYKFIKVQDEHQLAKGQASFFQQPAVLLPVFPAFVSQVPSGKDQYLALQYHSPPDPRLNSVYLSNCVFRI